VKRLLPWLIPLITLIAAGALGWQALAQRGPLIQVEFASGEGIAPGDPVSFRGVRIGEVRSVTLSSDLARVVVEARLRKDAAGMAVEGSTFWIVRPEISASRVTGLDTLLGPRYLECRPGAGARATRFAGLARPPGSATEQGALEVIVEAAERGSLVVDSPVTYRGIKVGAVRSLALAADARNVEVTLLVDENFRNLVRSNSRFWSAGGIGVDWGLSRGLSFKAESLETLMAGAIAFATPTKPGDAVQNGQRFSLATEPKSEWLEWSPAIELTPDPSGGHQQK
jgi:paraquat-inducible protein B